jgi:DNA-binding NarL/FixJ family response regulator
MAVVPKTPGPHPARVLCIDDNRDMTAVMRLMINAEPHMRCVGCLWSADPMLSEVRRLSQGPQTQPLIVLLDASMPGKDPLTAMGEVNAEFPGVRTIIYSGHDDPNFVQRAIKAGAYRCVSKRDDSEAVLRAVREAAAG